MDVNYSHEFWPNNKGLCKQLVGGKKRGVKHCGLPKEALVHQRWDLSNRMEESLLDRKDQKLINALKPYLPVEVIEILIEYIKEK